MLLPLWALDPVSMANLGLNFKKCERLLMELERKLLSSQKLHTRLVYLHSGCIAKIVSKINKTGEKSNPDWNDQETWPNPKQETWP